MHLGPEFEPITCTKNMSIIKLLSLKNIYLTNYYFSLIKLSNESNTMKEGLFEDSEIEIMEAGYEEDMEQTEIKTEGWEINTSKEVGSLRAVDERPGIKVSHFFILSEFFSN